MRFYRLAVIICASFSICAGPRAFASDVELGQPAPSIVAKTLDGGEFALAKAVGKVVIVNFWATWCGPCREEMPALEAYYRQHRADGLEVVAISADVPDDLAKVNDVMKAYSFPAALISDSRLAGYGRIRQIPQTYVIDAQGVMRRDGNKEKGKIDAAFLESVVTPLLPRKNTVGAGAAR